MSKETEFLKWWDDGEVSDFNPYSKGTPIWWAWEGYLIGVNANRTTKDSLSVDYRLKPLTKNEINKLPVFSNETLTLLDFVRIIEAAHGIKGEE